MAIVVRRPLTTNSNCNSTSDTPSNSAPTLNIIRNQRLNSGSESSLYSHLRRHQLHRTPSLPSSAWEHANKGPASPWSVNHLPIWECPRDSCSPSLHLHTFMSRCPAILAGRTMPQLPTPRPN